jgi:integrase
MATVYRKKDPHTGKPYVCWYYRFKNHAGRQQYGKGWPSRQKTLDHALAVEAEHRAIARGEKELPGAWVRLRNTPIKEVTRQYLEEGRAHGGIGGRPWAAGHYRHREVLMEFWTKKLGLQTLADVDAAKVEKVARELLKKRTGKTVAGYLEGITGLCHWAVKRGFLPSYPLGAVGKFDLKPKNPHRLLTDEEIAKLLAAAPPGRQLLYRTALATGYRAKEMRSLKVRDLDLFGPSLPLSGDFTKNREDARQPITRELAEEIAAFAKGCPPDSPLLRSPRQETMTENLNRDLAKAKIAKETLEGKATFHSFRVNYINAVAESGADLKTIMTLARHKSAQMSMEVYCKAKPARLREVAQRVAERLNRASGAPGSSTGVAQAVGAENEKPASTAATGTCGRILVVPPVGFEPTAR